MTGLAKASEYKPKQMVCVCVHVVAVEVSMHDDVAFTEAIVMFYYLKFDPTVWVTLPHPPCGSSVISLFQFSHFVGGCACVYVGACVCVCVCLSVCV